MVGPAQRRKVKRAATKTPSKLAATKIILYHDVIKFQGVGQTVLSQTAEYALRAVLRLAVRDQGEERSRASVRDLAHGLEIPQNYLSKILNQLVRAGVLVSSRGKHGGFQLARPASALTLLEVITPFDRPDQRKQCLLGQSTCSDETPCAAHWRWRALGEEVADFFRDTTVAELLRGAPISS